MGYAWYLSCCAIHKREAFNLQEWIEYHLLMGIEHFCLFDNNWPPDPDTLQVLSPYIKAGVVENIAFPGVARQYPAYVDGFRRMAGKTRWLAFIDIDEFVFPVEKETVAELLAEYEAFGGLAINWCCFGSSGLEKRPACKVNELIYRAPNDFEPNRHVKTIVQPDHALGPSPIPHFCEYRPGYFAVNELKSPVNGAFSEPSFSRIRVNHYIIGSKQNFEVKSARKHAACGMLSPYDTNYWHGFDRNEIRDDSASIKIGATLLNRIAAEPLQWNELHSLLKKASQMKREEAIAFAEGIPGWMLKEELGWLYDTASALPIGAVSLEVGVFQGRSFFCSGFGMTLGTLVGVSTFMDEGSSDANGESSMRARFDHWHRAAQSHSPLHAAIFQMTSVRASRLFANGTFDSIFIDGDHSYDSVKADIEAWSPKLKPDGILCGHDYQDAFPGVISAVNQLVPNVQRGPGTIWYSVVQQCKK